MWIQLGLDDLPLANPYGGVLVVIGKNVQNVLDLYDARLVLIGRVVPAWPGGKAAQIAGCANSFVKVPVGEVV